MQKKEFNKVTPKGLSGKVRELAGKGVAGASLMAISGLVAAQTAGADIVTMIDDHKATGLLVAGAGTVAILAIKYAKLPRGA